jgi:hypothetical protein
MATGILGQSAPTAATNTTVYTVPASTVGTISINAVSTLGQGGAISIALSATGTPGSTEWLEYNVQVPGNTALERTGIVMQAGKNVVVFATAGFVVSVYGYETAA